MIVLDASVAVEILLGSTVGLIALDTLEADGESVHAPELLDVEVLHVLRRVVAQRRMTERRAEQAMAILADFPVQRHGHAALLVRCWQHRANLTAYDAMYVALAEGLQATLLTCDAGIASAPGVQARVEVVRS